MAVCRDCGSLDIQLDEPADDGYYAVLVTLSDQVPSEESCDAWLVEHDYTLKMASAVAQAMKNALWYDIGRGAWYTLQVDGAKEKRKYYKSIVLTWYSWMRREARLIPRTGPGSGMMVKKKSRYW